MQTRRADVYDIVEMQHTNLCCLPENYNLRYYFWHYLSSPQTLFVTDDYKDDAAGYVLSRLEDEDNDAKSFGHVTSLAVVRTHRKLGIASTVMRHALKSMEEITNANYSALHVRKTNAAALHLYQETLGYRCADVERNYYFDDEDAYHMKKYFHGKHNPGAYINEKGELIWQKRVAEDSINQGTSKASSQVENAAGEKMNATSGGKQGKKDNGKKKKNAALPCEISEDLIKEIENTGREGAKSHKGKSKGKKK